MVLFWESQRIPIAYKCDHVHFNLQKMPILSKYYNFMTFGSLEVLKKLCRIVSIFDFGIVYTVIVISASTP